MMPTPRSQESGTVVLGGTEQQLAPEQLDVLRHTLGYEADRRRHERNYYCETLTDGSASQAIQGLVALGLMRSGPRINAGTAQYFYATSSGHECVKLALPKPPRRTRAQRRYAEYLAADSGLSFREWLGIAPPLSTNYRGGR